MANAKPAQSKSVAATKHVADVVAEVEAAKGAPAVNEELMARMAALEAENLKLKGSNEMLAVAPGLVTVQRMQGVFPGLIKNADVKFDDLPKQAAVTDQERSRPLPGMRFKTARGNERVDF